MMCSARAFYFTRSRDTENRVRGGEAVQARGCDDVHNVNAARVPLSQPRTPSARRHHLSLTLEDAALELWR